MISVQNELTIVNTLVLRRNAQDKSRRASLYDADLTPVGSCRQM
jgi:hypothetical protein